MDATLAAEASENASYADKSPRILRKAKLRVALANKNARIVWSVLAGDEDYRPGQAVAAN